MGVNYQKALETFNAYRDYIQEVVRGVQVKLGVDGVEFQMSIKKKMDAVLKLSDNPATSIVAIRDAEYLMAQVEDTMFIISIVKAEIKNVLNRVKTDKEIVKYSSTALKEINDCYGLCCDYFDIVRFKYETVKQLIESVRSINSMLKTKMERDINNQWIR